MVTTCIEALKARTGSRVVVAPYEADAQLAMLVYDGVASAVVTEDSDILVYAALCADASQRNVDIPLLTKLEGDGSLTEIRWSVQLKGAAVTLRSAASDEQESAEDDKGAAEAESTRFLKALKFFNGPNGGRLFLQACILAGSDYSESLPGIGIVGAATLVNKFKTFPDDARLASIVRFVKRGAAAKEKKRGSPKASTLRPEDVPEDYAEQLRRAEIAFRQHPVFVVDQASAAAGLGFAFKECLHLEDALTRGFDARLSSVLADPDRVPSIAPAEDEDKDKIDGAADGDLATKMVDAFAEGEQASREATKRPEEFGQVAGRLPDRSCVMEVADGALDPDSLKPRPPPLMALNHPTYLYSKGVKKRILQPKKLRGRKAEVDENALTLTEVWAASEEVQIASYPGTGSALQRVSYQRSSVIETVRMSVEETREAAARGCNEAMSQIFSKRAPQQLQQSGDSRELQARLEESTLQAKQQKQVQPQNSNPFAVDGTVTEKAVRQGSILQKQKQQQKQSTALQSSRRGKDGAMTRRPQVSKAGDPAQKKRRLAASLGSELAARKKGSEEKQGGSTSGKRQASLSAMFKSKSIE
eukprot:scaffold334_cov241-Pinguiococcus_pyrenoidosus.AAC.30